jgi:DNA helicase HerA-like ATPase
VNEQDAADVEGSLESPNVTSEAVEEASYEVDDEVTQDQSAAAEEAIRSSLVTLGFVSFDSSVLDNNTSGLMASADRRRHFRRDVYVGIRDEEQGIEFLGRIVDGPFHAPHEISAESAITRTTVLHPERTAFRPAYYVHGAIEVLGEIRGEERILPTPTRPRPYSEIYVFPPDRLRHLLGLHGEFFLGHLMGYEQVQVHADIESKNFLPRNVGVFGTVGSGKSNTVQVLMEESLARGWSVVTVDIEGEYVRMNEGATDPSLRLVLSENFGLEPNGINDFRVYVPSSGTSDAVSPTSFKVPISEVEPDIVADILEFSEAQVRMFGTITANALRQGGGASSSRLGPLAPSTRSGASTRPYSLQTLIDGLDDGATPAYPLVPNIAATERVTAATLRSKLIRLGRSGMLDWGATASIPELPVLDLLVPGRLSIIDVSETDDRSRNIAISYVLQALFENVLDTDRGQPMPTGSIRPPVLVVIEEVHTFVSKAAAPKMRSVIDQLQFISRRGRKRWMGLALVSQQPGHVPDELFELSNTRFIHQLKSAANLAPVRQTTGGVHEALWSTVPALAPGQCLLSGAIFRNPIFVTMRPATSRRLLVD